MEEFLGRSGVQSKLFESFIFDGRRASLGQKMKSNLRDSTVGLNLTQSSKTFFRVPSDDVIQLDVVLFVCGMRDNNYKSIECKILGREGVAK